MGIQTDSTALEDPKDPDTCTVFTLYSLLAPASSISGVAWRAIKGVEWDTGMQNNYFLTSS